MKATEEIDLNHFHDLNIESFSDASLSEVSRIVHAEILKRERDNPSPKTKGEIAMDAFMEEAQEIAEGMEQLKNERVF